MVANADAVVDPRTMVVVPVNALVANHAVAASGSADCVALGAQGGAVEELEEFDEFDVLVCYVAGVDEYEEYVEEQRHGLHGNRYYGPVAWLTAVDVEYFGEDYGEE